MERVDPQSVDPEIPDPTVDTQWFLQAPLFRVLRRQGLILFFYYCFSKKPCQNQTE